MFDKRLILFISLINCLILCTFQEINSKIEVVKSDDPSPVNIDDYFPKKPSVVIELMDNTKLKLDNQHNIERVPQKVAKVSRIEHSDSILHSSDIEEIKINGKQDKKNRIRLVSSNLINIKNEPIKIVTTDDLNSIKASNVKEEVIINLKNENPDKSKVKIDEESKTTYTNSLAKKFLTFPNIFKFGFNLNNAKISESNLLESPIKISGSDTEFEDFGQPSFYHDDIFDDSFDLDKDKKKDNNFVLSRFEFGHWPSFIFPRIFRFDTHGNDLEDSKLKGNRVALFIYRINNKDKPSKEKKPQPHLKTVEVEKDENNYFNNIFENYNLDDYRVYSNVLLMVIGVLLIISGVKLFLLLTKDRKNSQTLYQIDETQLIFDDSSSEKDKKQKS